MSLLVATRAQPGDISYPPDDKPDKALQLCEVGMFLESGEAVLENVFMLIRITHYKGNRYASCVLHDLTTYH